MITRVAAALLSLDDKHIAGYHARPAYARIRERSGSCARRRRQVRGWRGGGFNVPKGRPAADAVFNPGTGDAVHVSLDEDGEVSLDAVIKGDTVREVLHYVQYSADELASQMRKDVERALRAGKISLEESRQLLRFYESGLEGYTYLEEP